MADRPQGGDLFIVDNADDLWKVQEYLREWAEIAHTFDVATGYFEIGALLALDGQWQKLDKLRILMGDEVTSRTRAGPCWPASRHTEQLLDESIEREKEKNDFLHGVPAIVEAMQKRQDRVPRLHQGQVPRQGLHHPRTARGGGLFGPGRLEQLHLSRA